ncbi:hypothetical protein GCM10011499_14200 [Pelagibacterium lentulum]|uniref:Uncharacterized protein n=1 Tax=Pelagibacterium lentulum TaxID=2029865 RepID=A0A916RAB3_9HYPH|nr:hypothetical protein GCM10011499_14200 [Pelagibacterium lentulum]
MISAGAAPEAMVAPAPIVSMKARAFFTVKWATGPHIALAGLALALVPQNMLAHHLRNRQAVSDFIEKSIGKAHEH